MPFRKLYSGGDDAISERDFNGGKTLNIFFITQEEIQFVSQATEQQRECLTENEQQCERITSSTLHSGTY